ncbi:hypothetical protein CsatB_029032 [Cannabis sativa]|uniref:Response regulatory domain-containing protein n=1 Tax=Cannabis sativa TaxID=3483 RepID=A0A803PYD0_CANSA|nr:two-component response regulator ARR22 [Cannabis sativa]
MVLGNEVVGATHDHLEGKEITVSNVLVESNTNVDDLVDLTATAIAVENKLSSSTVVADDDEKKPTTVLIVEDQKFARMVHNSLARGLGMETHEAVNGKMAVDLHRSGASFDLILMDREMPIMDGAKATEELRAMGVESMIVGVTASDHEQIQAFLKAGLDHCVVKPLTRDMLVSIMQLFNETKLQKKEKDAPTHNN